MEPIRFPEVNEIITSESFPILPVSNHTQQGCNAVTSVWEPSEKERNDLEAGGKIAITLLTDEHPPVSVGVYIPEPGTMGTQCTNSDCECQS